MKDLRIVFMGTPDFAVGVLEKLLEAGCTVVGVITAPDRPAGRGRKVSESAVKSFAQSQGLNILQPTNLKSEDFLAALTQLKADLQIVVAFRMLPKAVWSMPRLGTFNLHASLLPHYRGAAPINWAIMNGETITGVTTFFIDEKIDTGAIIASEEICISPRETAGSLHDRLMELGSALVVATVEKIAKGTVQTTRQPESSSYKEAPKLSPENTRIDWSCSVSQIDAFIRGLSPYPVAWTLLNNNGEELKVKIYEAMPENMTHDDSPGSIHTTKKELKVATKDGYLIIKELQLPGKRRMPVADLLNGFPIAEDAKMM
ncbi:methionyl-tRNA formyltransferase [Altibacter sp.]|uniref:methionyl-tRNA formyltransferase n=1 Tax=Altibacter sp. TaxID=2024823 RepID=UPI000C8F580A|nr:methionyl-tRNA formyltransferase [Altibacter sp.]MAP53471.1 methionyl-tRNA formyltransferase [Altibacter sp.]